VADIVFHPEAQDEYERALAWYQARSARTAGRFEAEVQRLLGLVQLKGYPEIQPCATRSYGEWVPRTPAFPGPPGPQAVRKGQPVNPESFPAYDDEHRFAVLRRFVYTLVY
jgi:hypothetical protein